MATPRDPTMRRRDEGAALLSPITPETGLRWAALLYSLVSIVVGLILVSRGFGDLLKMGIGALVILQGWALLGFFSLFADVAQNTAEIARALRTEER